MRTLLILSAGIEAVPGILKAKKMGLKVVVCDQNINAPGFKYADYKIFKSIYNYSELLDSVESFNHNIKKINGVIAISSDTSVAVSIIAKKLKIPGNSIITAKLSTDKLKMKEKLKKCGIPIPWFSEVKNLNHLKKILKDKKIKYIIKPVDSRGSRGVLQIDSRSDLEWSYKHCLQESKSKKIIIEKFLVGKQISTESIIYGENAFTPGLIERNYEYLNKFHPYIIENGGQQPVTLSKNNINKISELTIRAAKCLGVKYGTVKGDIVFHQGKPYIIEIATRLSGGWMSSDQIPLATGVDILKIAIQIALGDKIDLNNLKINKKKAVAIRYFFPKSGKIFSIKRNMLKKNNYIKKFMFYLKNKTIVPKVTDHTKRAGFVITCAQTKKKAVNEAKKFINSAFKK
jgi:biotin carboxylase